MKCRTVFPGQEVTVSVLNGPVNLLGIYSLALPTNRNLLLKNHGLLPSTFESIGRY